MIEPDDKIAVMCGTGVPGSEEMLRMLNAMVPEGMVIATRDPNEPEMTPKERADWKKREFGVHYGVKLGDEVVNLAADSTRDAVRRVTSSRGLTLYVPKITNPERDAWNAAVDAKKAAKKAAKGKK